jgi:hypothetical protein
MPELSTTPTVPVVAVGPVDLRVYDQLLSATESTTHVEDQPDRDGDDELEGTAPPTMRRTFAAAAQAARANEQTFE